MIDQEIVQPTKEVSRQANIRPTGKGPVDIGTLRGSLSLRELRDAHIFFHFQRWKCPPKAPVLHQLGTLDVVVRFTVTVAMAGTGKAQPCDSRPP